MAKFDFSKEPLTHPNLSSMTEEERFEERMRNLMSPILTYFQLLNDEDFKELPESSEMLKRLENSASESASRIQTIFKGNK